MIFVYEWNLRWLPSSKDNAHAYIHKKQKNIVKRFIYKNPDTFQKARQFPLRFYIQKAIHLTLRDFHEISEVGIYTKSMTLCVTWRFYIQKARHFAKSKTICDTFYIQKSGTFALRDFLLNFWNLRRGRGIY